MGRAVARENRLGVRHMGTINRRGIGRLFALLLAVMAVGLLSAQAAFADTQVIHSDTGPLANIWVGDNMNCQVQRQGQNQNSYEFFSGVPGSCGTMLSVNNANGDGAQLFGLVGTAYTVVNPPTLSGSGTSDDPYRITTVGDAGTTGLRVTEVDTYVATDNYYRTDITVANNTQSDATGKLYHAADCYLEGSDSGYGWTDPSQNAVACTQTPNNEPPAEGGSHLIEEFAPVTAGANYFEAGYSTNWSEVESQVDYPDTCDCNTREDNGMGVNWDYSVAPGQSKTFSLLSNFSPSGVTAPTHTITATGGRSFSGDKPYTVDGTVADFTDSKSGTSPSDYTATIDWGDQSSPTEGGINSSGDGFTVTGTHSYNDAGSYQITVTIRAIDGNANSPSVTDTATVNSSTVPSVNPGPTTSPPTAVTQPTSTSQSNQGQLTGTVNPGGLPTTVHWRYGLDQSYRGPGFTGDIYDQSTPDQSAGSGSSDESVSTSVSGLQPNSVYHYRLVATNSKGTTVGEDRTFKTAADGLPSTPVVGQSGNFTPAGGTVFVLINGQFVKLTEVRQLPDGTVVDALHGTLKLTVASGQNIASAKRRKTYTGTFSGAVFKVHQAKTGRNRALTTLSLAEGAFKGGPSYASCQKKAPRALSSRTLQTLRSRASGRFRTRGRYSAGTVRGTRWTTVDRCDGTLISVQLHSVLVRDFVKHISVLVSAGHSYFAAAHPARPRRIRPPFTG